MIKKYQKNKNTGVYSSVANSRLMLVVISVIGAVAVSMFCSMFESLAQLTVFLLAFACSFVVISACMGLWRLSRQLGSWRYVWSYWRNLDVTRAIYRAMLSNQKSQVVELPRIWTYEIGQTLLIKMAKTAGIFSADLPKLEELIGSALQGRYHDYAVIESHVDHAQNYLIFRCRNVNIDQTFRPTELADFRMPLYQVKLQNDLVVNLAKNPHIAIWGRTGSGKTTVLYYIVSELMSNDSEIYIADGKQEFYGLKNFYSPDHIAEEPKMMLQMLDVVVKNLDSRQHLVAKEIKNRGEVSLTADALGLKPIVLIVDEVASVLAQFSPKDRSRFLNLLMQIVQKGRSAGVFLVIASQSPATEVLPNSIRSQFGTKILLGSASDEVQKMAFGRVATSGDVPAYTGYYSSDGEIRPKKYFVPDLGEWANLVTFERLHEER